MAKIVVRKNDFMDRFSTIEIAEPTIADAVQAVMMADKNYARFFPALLSIISTFDGKRLPMEDVAQIPVSGLVPMLTELFGVLELDLLKLADRLLHSLNLADGDGTTSGDSQSAPSFFSSQKQPH